MSPLLYKAPRAHACPKPGHKPGDRIPPDGSIWQCDDCHRYFIVKPGVAGQFQTWSGWVEISQRKTRRLLRRTA